MPCWINYDVTPLSNFQPIRLLNPGCWYKFTYLITNSVDPDQLASDLDLHCFQRQGIYEFSRTWVKPVLVGLGWGCVYYPANCIARIWRVLLKPKLLFSFFYLFDVSKGNIYRLYYKCFDQTAHAHFAYARGRVLSYCILFGICIFSYSYRIYPKYSDTLINSLSSMTWNLKRSILLPDVMLKGAANSAVANSVDPDLRRLIWVDTICSGLSVRILGVSTVLGNPPCHFTPTFFIMKLCRYHLWLVSSLWLR